MVFDFKEVKNLPWSSIVFTCHYLILLYYKYRKLCNKNNFFQSFITGYSLSEFLERGNGVFKSKGQFLYTGWFIQ